MTRPQAGEFEVATGVLIGGPDPGSFATKDRVRWKGALWLGPEAELYYMRARWYEAGTVRFLSEDPVGLAGEVNPYVYAGSEPVNGSDPSGLEKCYVKGTELTVSLAEWRRRGGSQGLGGVKISLPAWHPSP